MTKKVPNKKAAGKETAISITLNFTVDEINRLLEAATYDGEPLTFAEIKKDKKALDFLITEFDPEQIKEEFIDGSYEAIANDWLAELSPGGWVYGMLKGEEEEED